MGMTLKKKRGKCEYVLRCKLPRNLSFFNLNINFLLIVAEYLHLVFSKLSRKYLSIAL